MNAVEALARRLPGDADRIRQRFWRDREFRSLCDDFRDAAEAQARFATCDPARADEYGQLAAELLAEAVALLRGNDDVNRQAED